MSRFVDPAEVEPADPALRPIRLEDYVGQERIKDNLRVYIRAAIQRGEALDHVLLSGPPGLGKTSLAHILAEELGVELRTASGPTLERGGDLAAILNNWGTSGGKQPRSDVNSDGIVDGADLAEVLNSWGTCP